MKKHIEKRFPPFRFSNLTHHSALETDSSDGFMALETPVYGWGDDVEMERTRSWGPVVYNENQ